MTLVCYANCPLKSIFKLVLVKIFGWNDFRVRVGRKYTHTHTCVYLYGVYMWYIIWYIHTHIHMYNKNKYIVHSYPPPPANLSQIYM